MLLYTSAVPAAAGEEALPFYDLHAMKRLMGEGRYRITVSALQNALLIGFGVEDTCDCILHSLNETHFYKTMPAEKAPGLWQDVYYINHQGVRVYLKLQIGFTGHSVVISFKEDTS